MYNCNCCSREFNSKKALNGHLGQIASVGKHTTAKLTRIDAYNQKPTLCLQCNCHISYKDRKNTFCSQSCSATFNNVSRGKTVKQCKICNKEFAPTTSSHMYCSTECSHENKRRAKDTDISSGAVHHRPTLRKFVSKRDGWKCSVCETDSWMGQNIPLELDHIDGNASNNYPSNLRLVCPNCHAQTTTFKARNKGFGRKSLGLL